jgi:methyltransferase
MLRLLALAIAVFAPMLIEARRAWRNERVQRARGGVEPPHDVYRIMQVAYPGVFAAMVGEGLLRPPPPMFAVAIGSAIFIAGKLLKWWAIVTLGRSWTFRVVVVPGAPLMTGGPYRYLRHPNYVGVLGELGGGALVAGAQFAGPVGILLFAALIGVRIRVENRALHRITGSIR